jgi:hypothetical protein
MGKQLTLIEKLVVSAVDKVSHAPYFTKTEVKNHVLKHSKLPTVLSDLRKHHGAWHLDVAVMEYMDGCVGHELQRKDANNIREYEQYATGMGGERRWMRLRAMNADQLRAAIGEARTQRQRLDSKIKVYEVLLDMLEEFGKGSVEDIYDEAVAKLHED